MLSCRRSLLDKALGSLLLQVFVRSSYTAVIYPLQFAELTELHSVGSKLLLHLMLSHKSMLRPGAAMLHCDVLTHVMQMDLIL